MTTPNKIHQLIAQFELNLDAYKHGNYNETQVRLEFIDPFFKELAGMCTTNWATPRPSKM